VEPVIVFEDNHIIVGIKPHNVPTQEDQTGDLDFLNIVKNYIKTKYDKPGNAFVGLLHRLDRPTGGLMIFAKTSKAAGRLSQQIKNGEVDKRYLAVVVGSPKFRADRLTNYLKKDEKANIVKLCTALEEGAKKAILDYKVLETNSDLSPPMSLVDINLLTGRSHQIRVQMQNLGHSLIGDTKYGTIKAKNLALWAYELRCTHPVTKQSMRFVAYPPIDHLPWKLFNVDKYINVYKPLDN